MALYNKLRERNIFLHNPKPVMRRNIKKKNGSLRPLGIPTITDRVYQNIVKMALEPQWEVKLEASSYGYRPKRNSHDAIECIRTTVMNSDKHWVFEGDFKGCFNNLNHDFLLGQLQNFPAKGLVEKWLKAGYVDNNAFYDTEKGTPQGGIISPLLANIALHGMEESLGILYESSDARTLVRYADDFLIMCNTKEDANSMYYVLKPYLEKRGLVLEDSKTQVVHLSEGFEFLGFAIKQLEKTRGESRLMIRPSDEKMDSHKLNVSTKFKKCKGKNVGHLIAELNPIILGHVNYYKTVDSKDYFSNIDEYIRKKTYVFLRELHPDKSWKWIKESYLKPDIHGVNKGTLFLTDPKKSSHQLMRMTDIPNERHSMINYGASIYDKSLEEYFKERDIERFHARNLPYRQELARKQNYLCPICSKPILDRRSLNIHHKIPGNEDLETKELVHRHCHRVFHRFGARQSVYQNVD